MKLEKYKVFSVDKRWYLAETCEEAIEMHNEYVKPDTTKDKITNIVFVGSLLLNTEKNYNFF